MKKLNRIKKAEISLKELGYSKKQIDKILDKAINKDSISRVVSAGLVYGKLTIIFYLTLVNMALNFSVIFVPAIFLKQIPNLLTGVIAVLSLLLNGFIFAKTKKERDYLVSKYDLKGEKIG